ncbi:MAG: hypothetical protein H6Q00_1802 [Holophagaceae bacterium]|nr:hypothetical protein [Holophagaceae bacterium]
MPKGRERRLLYIREYREDGKLVVRAIPCQDDNAGQGQPIQVMELKQKVS